MISLFRLLLKILNKYLYIKSETWLAFSFNRRMKIEMIEVFSYNKYILYFHWFQTAAKIEIKKFWHHHDIKVWFRCIRLSSSDWRQFFSFDGQAPVFQTVVFLFLKLQKVIWLFHCIFYTSRMTSCNFRVHFKFKRSFCWLLAYISNLTH